MARQVVIWAGMDIFSTESIAETDDPQATYQQVSQLLMPKLEEEFGKGVELQMENKHTFRINVDHVEVAWA